MSKSLKSLLRNDLIALAEDAKITLTHDEKGKVLETRDQIIALLEKKNNAAEENIEDLDSLLDIKDTKSDDKEETKVLCPFCLENGVTKVLTETVIKYCADKFPGKKPTCFIHQNIYRKEAKKNDTYEKNIASGNVCFECGNPLSDAELKYNKEHHNEYPDGLQGNLYCRRCQPDKETTGYRSAKEAMADSQQCFVCGRELAEGEKEMGYYHHNKYGKYLTDKCLCFGCVSEYASNKVVQLYKNLKSGKINKPATYNTPKNEESKVAEDKAQYSTPIICSCCGNPIVTDKAKQLNAIAKTMVPELKGIDTCIVCLSKMGYLKDINK